MEKIRWKPVFFDSMGAKCASVLVRTPDTSILIDPGAAEMQPSYPLSWEMKMKYLRDARRALDAASTKAEVVVVSHYHYDHHSLLDTDWMDAVKLYRGKVLYAKNPNSYVNESQWKRARLFYSQICEKFGGVKLDDVVVKSGCETYPEPMQFLPLASSKNWGSYAERKRMLIEKGRRWFRKLVKGFWGRRDWVPELSFRGIKVCWADGRRVKVGGTEIIFSKPRFHGLEFDRVGWVFSTTVRYGKEKLTYTSDLEGVFIEDYKEDLIEENPDILIVDGPATYLFGFMINRINLNRSIENLREIVERTSTKLIILDHHLLREHRYMERLKDVYDVAEKNGKTVITAAEYLGGKPKILEIMGKKTGKPA